MKRIAGKGIGLTVLATLAMSGQAAAFTPVPIPTPRTGTAAVAHVAYGQADAVMRRGQVPLSRSS
ncbi:MAG: hypothetical protein JO243_03260 [Solirubrobacterales bacterium]|nr:hypothetical protein [Solirubrobacterales bacterium]